MLNFLERKNKINGKFLDIGAGTGIFPYALKKLNLNIDCIETDENFRKHLKSNLNLNLITDNYHSKKLRSKYDVISINKVLEHVSNLDNFLNKILIVLKKNGYLYFEVPDAQKAGNISKNREELFIEHVHGFSQNRKNTLNKKIFQ